VEWEHVNIIQQWNGIGTTLIVDDWKALPDRDRIWRECHPLHASNGDGAFDSSKYNFPSS
jgi:hypothetical protein